VNKELSKLRRKEKIVEWKSNIKKIPFLGNFIKKIAFILKPSPPDFPGTLIYWENNYAAKNSSGPGSYGKFAESKAHELNTFVKERDIQSVIEFGCGDGNQLSYARYPQYIGLDISKTAIGFCKELYKNDPTKKFFQYFPMQFDSSTEAFKAELAVSLDVIYHIIEDDLFEKYLGHLFSAAQKYVIIFAADIESPFDRKSHVRHRKFSKWIENNLSDWKLEYTIPPEKQLCSNYSFYVYKKTSVSHLLHTR
jgi:cyclopropane fatty-acyl-phospholipid synthase-like methyltransferase